MIFTNSLQTLKEYWTYIVPDKKYETQYVDMIWKYIGNSHWYTQSLVSDLLYCFDELYRNCKRNYAKIEWIDNLDWTQIGSDGIWTQSTAVAPSVEVQSILDDVKVVNTQQKSNKQLSIRDQWMFLQSNSEDIIINRYLLQNAKHHFGFLHRTIELEFYDLTGWYLQNQNDTTVFGNLHFLVGYKGVYQMSFTQINTTTYGNVSVFDKNGTPSYLPTMDDNSPINIPFTTEQGFDGVIINGSPPSALGTNMQNWTPDDYVLRWTV